MNAIEENYFCKDSEGRLTTLLVAIQIPIFENGDYSTRVVIGDRNVGRMPIRGVTAMQSLELAIDFAKKLLNGFIEDGNRIYIARPGTSDPKEDDLWRF